jgi:hypothetical protein
MGREAEEGVNDSPPGMLNRLPPISNVLKLIGHCRRTSPKNGGGRRG